MTLLQQIACKDEFVIVSADTRTLQLLYTHNSITGKTTDRAILGTTDEADKVRLLTNKVIFSCGGFSDHGDRIFRRLSRRIEPHFDLDDCRTLIEEIAPKYLNRYKNTRMANILMEIDHTFTIFLTGFRKNGNAGVIIFNPTFQLYNETKSCFQFSWEVEPDPLFIEIYAPTTELNEMKWTLYSPGEIVRMDSPLNTFYTHMVKVHAIVSHLQPKEVSPDCLHHILFKDQAGDIKYLQTRTDLTSLQSELPTKEELLMHYTR